MDNIKIKEQELLQTLSKLDLFTDLVANSKKKIVDLETVKSDLEVEKKDLIEKLSTFENENKSLLNGGRTRSIKVQSLGRRKKTKKSI